MILLTASCPAGEDLDMDDVVQLGKQYFDKIKDLQLTYRVYNELKPPLPKNNQGGLAEGDPRIYHWSYMKDGSRQKIEAVHYHDKQFAKPKRFIINAWDGKKCYSWDRNVIMEAKGHGLTPDNKPENLGAVTIYSDRNLCDVIYPYWAYLKFEGNGALGIGPNIKEQCRVVKVDTVQNNRRCVLIEGNYQRIWVDQILGLYIRAERYRKSGFQQKRESQDLRSLTQMIKIQEFNGVSLPTEIKLEQYYGKNDQFNKSGVEVLRTVHINVDPQSVKIDQGLDPAFFKVDFPLNVPVFDWDTKTLLPTAK